MRLEPIDTAADSLEARIAGGRMTQSGPQAACRSRRRSRKTLPGARLRTPVAFVDNIILLLLA